MNPELTVPLSYPPATAACASPTAVSAAEDPSLAITGGQLPVVAIGIGGTALVVGIGVVLLRRRRTHS